MRCDCVHKILSSSFRCLGLCVGKHPFPFIFIPLIFVIIMSMGMFRVSLTNDAEYLYTPINGRSWSERDAVESLFPLNVSDFDIVKMTRFGRLGILILESRDGGSMLRKHILSELIKIDNIVKNFTIIWKNRTITYKDLCLKSYTGECVENYVIYLEEKLKRTEEKQFRIKYPVEQNELTQSIVVTAINFGGVTTDENNYVKTVKSFRLMYPLDYTTKEKNEMSLLWEKTFLVTVSHIQSDYVNIYRLVASTFDSEFHRVTEMSMSLIFVAAPLMIMFAVVTCMTTDWVTSKPWIGFAGCIIPITSGITTAGFLLFCGAEYVDFNITMLFLLLGIGLDDSFVLLAAWRRTDPKESVEKRISDAYSDAAVSITITSLTNILSFSIGVTTPYRIIQIYCVYASMSMLFAYIFQITLFGGLLVLSGHREKKFRHSVLCIPVNLEKKFSCFVLRFLYIGLRGENEKGLLQSDVSLSFYKNKIGAALIKPSVKFLVFLIFCAYLSGSIYCLKFLKQGFDYRKGFPYSSYAINFTTKHYEYFTDYPHAIQVVINKTLDYSDPQVQKDVYDILKRFSTAPHMAGEDLIDSWIIGFLNSLNNKQLWLSYRGYDISNPEDFIEALRNVFLKLPSSHRYTQDILLNENGTEIITSKFLVVSRNISTADLERKLLPQLWKISDSCKYPVYIHNYWFLILNQHLNIKETTIQSLSIASVVITAIFLLFIPNLVCAACVAFTIASIQIGIIGYMSLWNVSLDTISMLILIMAAGLSVDYAAHISYAYVTSDKKTPDEKTKAALYAAGHPIFQGCFSTVLALGVLAFGPSYSFVIFFKVLTLAMIFACLHGVFVLPIFLNVWETFWQRIHRKNKNQKVTEICEEAKDANNLLINGDAHSDECQCSGF